MSASATDAGTILALGKMCRARSSVPVGAVVQLNQGAMPPGIEVRERVGERYIVSAEPQALAAALAEGALRSVSVSRRLQRHNDLSAVGTGIAEIRRGVLGKQYNGKGVVVGLFDDGFDVRHINFRDTDGNSRIEAVFHYTSDDGTVTEYIGAAVDGFTYDTADMTHGTHVLGTIAGSYGGKCNMADSDGNTVTVVERDCPYQGAAPEATIAIGCGDLYDANILAGVKRISDYAREQGKPCVINLSLGSVLGPRDGTDDTAATLSTLADDAVIVVSAGNDANKGNTFSHDFTADRPHCGAAVRPWSLDPYPFAIDIWSRDDRPPAAKIAIIKATTGEAVRTYPYTPGADGVMTVDDSDPDFARHFSGSVSLAFSDNSATNRRAQYWMEGDISLNPGDTEHWNYNIAVIVEGETGMHVDVGYEGENAMLLQNPGTPWWDRADSDMSISGLACGDNIVSVGSWTTRNTWPCLDGTTATHGTDQTFPIGQTAPYSSFGTTVDGEELPTVCAPGNMILSSYSDYYVTAHNAAAECVAVCDNAGRKHYWGSYAGTSMASPAVAGGIALWLEAKPELTSAQVNDIIRRTAVPFSNNTVQCGAGKFDALAGLKEVIEHGGVPGIVTGADSPSYAVDLAGRRFPYPSALAPGIYIIHQRGKTVKLLIGE